MPTLKIGSSGFRPPELEVMLVTTLPNQVITLVKAVPISESMVIELDPPKILFAISFTDEMRE